MGTKAPYQTKQMKQILSYLQTVEGTHVTVADVCCYFKEQGITIIMISHDIAAAVKYATHILHIGEHCFFGTKKQYLQSSLGKAFTGQEGEDE